MREDRADQEIQGVLEIIEVEDDDLEVHSLGRPFAQDRNIWERQPWETDHDFALFTIYRDLPPMRRSQAEVIKVFRKDIPRDATIKEVNTAMVKDISVHSRWVERTEAYSMYIDDRLREALEEERVRTRIEYLDLGREMRTKAQQALSVMQAIVYDEDGTERSVLSPKQIIDLAKAAFEFEKFALLMDEPDRGTTVNIMNVSDSELVSQAKEVLSAYGGQLP